MSPPRELPPPGWVDIHYRRLPDRLTVFRQRLLAEEDGALVTLARGVELLRPVRAGEEVILDPGADAVWFTFPGLWHDIGRFHRKDGSFTGWYANILLPCTVEPDGIWHATDLCLDVWMSPDGSRVEVLDEAEFEEARVRGWIGAEDAGRALEEVERILKGVDGGSWPPPVARRWTRERALRGAAVPPPPEG